MFENRYLDLYVWRTPWWFLRICEKTVGVNIAFDLILISEILGLVLLILFGLKDPFSPTRFIAHVLIAPGVFWFLSCLFTKNPEFEAWLFKRVIRLCDRGDCPRARSLIEKTRDQGRIPEEFYQVLLAEILYRSGQGAEIIPVLEKSVELMPKNASVKINLAIGKLLFDHDSQLINALYESIPLVPRSQRDVFFHRSVALGLLKLREGKPSEAVGIFNESMKSLSGLANIDLHFPTRIEFVKGYLAIAYAKVGEIEQAKRLFTEVEARLRESRFDMLVQELETLLSE